MPANFNDFIKKFRLQSTKSVPLKNKIDEKIQEENSTCNYNLTAIGTMTIAVQINFEQIKDIVSLMFFFILVCFFLFLLRLFVKKAKYNKNVN